MPGFRHWGDLMLTFWDTLHKLSPPLDPLSWKGDVTTCLFTLSLHAMCCLTAGHGTKTWETTARNCSPTSSFRFSHSALVVCAFCLPGVFFNEGGAHKQTKKTVRLFGSCWQDLTLLHHFFFFFFKSETCIDVLSSLEEFHICSLWPLPVVSTVGIECWMMAQQKSSPFTYIVSSVLIFNQSELSHCRALFVQCPHYRVEATMLN